MVIQTDIVNRGSRTLIVAPLLPDHKNWPFAVNIAPTPQNGLDKPGHINLKQLRAIDVSGLNMQQGLIENDYQEAIEAELRIVFGL